MLVSVRQRYPFAILLRAGARLSVAGLFLLGTHNALQTAVAEGDTRTLSFHHLHTDEAITITFKRNGRFDDTQPLPLPVDLGARSAAYHHGR